MNLTEEKREMNNFLLRAYLSEENNDKKNWINILISNNLELVALTIANDYPQYKYKHSIYQIGINGLIKAIETYYMDKIACFEAFTMSVISNEIKNYINEPELLMVVEGNKSGLTIGDIWYSKDHDLDNLLSTKPYREKMLSKVYKMVK